MYVDSGGGAPITTAVPGKVLFMSRRSLKSDILGSIMVFISAIIEYSANLWFHQVRSFTPGGLV